MNWDAIGAIGELVGSLAVLITVLYLALQVKHARREMRIGTQRQRYETFRNLTQEMSRNAELRRIYSRLREGFTEDMETIDALFERCDLSIEDFFAYNSHQQALWMYRQETIENIDDLTADQRTEFEVGIRRMMGSGPGYLWYKGWREMAEKDNAVTVGMTYIDELLKNPLGNIMTDKSFISGPKGKRDGA